MEEAKLEGRARQARKSAKPVMGRARGELAAGMRSFPFERYIIFYAPVDGGIDVVRVLHSARDVDTPF